MTPCPPGTYSHQRSFICIPCSEGYKLDKERSSFFEKCPSGTYSPSGSIECFEYPK